MKHRIKGRRLGRDSQHRIALKRNLISALFVHGRIETTETKAKEYKGRAEKLITLGKVKSLHTIRQAIDELRNREAVAKLFDEIGPSFRDRPGGYTRIVRLPGKRLGDKGQKVYLELVNFVPKARETAATVAGAAADEGEE